MERPNMKYLEQLAGDDLAFQARFIDILKREFPAERTEYNEAIQQHDWVKAKELVHKIKHKISILGLERAYEIANRYEADLDLKNPRYHTAFDGILDKMEQYIKQLNP